MSPELQTHVPLDGDSTSVTGTSDSACAPGPAVVPRGWHLCTGPALTCMLRAPLSLSRLVLRPHPTQQHVPCTRLQNRCRRSIWLPPVTLAATPQPRPPPSPGTAQMPPHCSPRFSRAPHGPRSAKRPEGVSVNPSVSLPCSALLGCWSSPWRGPGLTLACWAQAAIPLPLPTAPPAPPPAPTTSPASEAVPPPRGTPGLTATLPGSPCLPHITASRPSGHTCHRLPSPGGPSPHEGQCHLCGLQTQPHTRTATSWAEPRRALGDSALAAVTRL